jgi:hypothetical protein
VAAAVLAVRPASERDVVTAPPPGGISYAKLANGTRLYVVRHADGTVTALDTVSTHAPTSVGKQVGWCASSGLFEDPVHGSRWDRHGVYVFGPAPRDLPFYRLVPRGGDRYRVGERVDPPARGTSVARAGGPPCNGGQVGAPPVVLWDGPGGGRDRTYTSAANLPDRRWVRLVGRLVLDENGTGRVCDREGARCTPVRLDGPAGGSWDAVRTYVVRREGTTVTGVVIAIQSRPPLSGAR